jgi:hypothetical protein
MNRTRLMAALVIGATAFVASAEDEVVDATPDAVPQVALDDLLSLPSGYQTEVQRRAGATQAEWRDRFAESRSKVTDAKRKLAKAEEELDQISETSSGWQVAAPGSRDPQTSPLSLRLREEVRGQRRAIDLAEREVRALDVQADLASVPQEWRE